MPGNGEGIGDGSAVGTTEGVVLESLSSTNSLPIIPKLIEESNIDLSFQTRCKTKCCPDKCFLSSMTEVDVMHLRKPTEMM